MGFGALLLFPMGFYSFRSGLGKIVVLVLQGCGVGCLS